MINKEKELQNGNDSKSEVKVYNNIRLSIHFGDSLNLLALIAGIFLIKNISKQRKTKKSKPYVDRKSSYSDRVQSAIISLRTDDKR